MKRKDDRYDCDHCGAVSPDNKLCIHGPDGKRFMLRLDVDKVGCVHFCSYECYWTWSLERKLTDDDMSYSQSTNNGERK